MRFLVCLRFGREVKKARSYNRRMSTRFSRAGRKPRSSSDDRVLPVPDGSKLPFPVEVEWTRLFLFTDTVDGFETASVQSVPGGWMSCLAISPESTVSVVIVLYCGAQ